MVTQADEPLSCKQLGGYAAGLFTEAAALSKDPETMRLALFLLRTGEGLLEMREWLNAVLEGLEDKNSYVPPSRKEGLRCDGRIVIHSADCIQTQASERARAVEYESRFANYCRFCKGYGLDPGTSESCPACLQRGACPRCQRRLPEKRDGGMALRCGSCFWTFADPQNSGRPQAPRCICHRIELTTRGPKKVRRMGRDKLQPETDTGGTADAVQSV